MPAKLPLDKLQDYNPILSSISLDRFVESRESYYYKLSKIQYSAVDDQIAGLWHPATVIYGQIKEEINPNNNTLLITVGESWTYGDSLKPLVRAVDSLDHLPYRLSHIFTSHIANWLKCDLLQYSEPGNANFDIWYNIDSLIEFAKSKNKYSKIYIIGQITTPGRDINFNNDRKLFEHDRFLRLFNTPTSTKISYSDWAKEYDQYYLDWARSISKRKDINGLVVWKNFNEFYSKDFKDLLVLEEPFINTGVAFSGHTTKLPINNHVEFFDYCKKIPILDVNTGDLVVDMDRLDNSYYLLSKSRLNDWHPNKIGHWVLATLIREKFKQVL